MELLKVGRAELSQDFVSRLLFYFIGKLFVAEFLFTISYEVRTCA